MIILKISEKLLLNARNVLLNEFRLCSLNVGVDLAPKACNLTRPDAIQRILKVAIIGMPNAGKSTLINILMDRKICPVSSKVHTTRTRATAIFTEDSTQIVFVDTPGLVNDRELKKMNLEKSFQRDVRRSVQESDIIGIIHDVSNVWCREKLDIKAVKALEYNSKKKSVLILNKIDMLKSKRKLLDLTRTLTEGCINGTPMAQIQSRRGTVISNENTEVKGWPNFSEIFMISALTGNGVDDVRKYFLETAKQGEWLFPPELYSDQLAENIIVNTVKATFLNYLQQEIPYACTPVMEYFENREDGSIKTIVLVKCPTARIKRLIAGINDGRLKQITASVQADLQSAFNLRVSIQIVLESPFKEK